MKKKTSRRIGVILCAIACIFILYAINHPEMSFSLPNYVTYAVYAVYVGLTVFFIAAPFKN